MAEVLALQDVELEGPDGATPRTGGCCFSKSRIRAAVPAPVSQ